MNIENLYLAVETDKNNELLHKIDEDFNDWKENGSDVLNNVKFPLTDGHIFWFNKIRIHYGEFYAFMWKQIYDYIGYKNNLFEYLFDIVKKYQIVCDCFTTNGDIKFINNLDDSLKNEIPNYINYQEFNDYVFEKRIKENFGLTKEEFNRLLEGKTRKEKIKLLKKLRDNQS